MTSCVIFGGSGFVGTHLAKYFIEYGIFEQVHIADIKPSQLSGTGILFSKIDVRNEIDLNTLPKDPDWIFNFAAVHREPGHLHNEYFETNLRGATNVCDYAEKANCRNIFFTSSISIYGPCLEPTEESKLPGPITPYGGSKYPAELIHQIWLAKSNDRRLIITRPGVIYGPGDPGNILRMIRAIKGGYFVFPGSKNIHKSYAYIFGFMDSILFTMNRSERLIVYNYVETPTKSIGSLAKIIKQKIKSSAPIVSIPSKFLLPLASVLQKLAGKGNPIHPVRVRKAQTPTHIMPKTLLELNYRFKYSFEESIDHWMAISPQDFD